MADCLNIFASNCMPQRGWTGATLLESDRSTVHWYGLYVCEMYPTAVRYHYAGQRASEKACRGKRGGAGLRCLAV